MSPLLFAAVLASQPAVGVKQEPAERRVLRIALLDLEATSVDARIVRVVTDSLLFELRKLHRVQVIGFDEIRTMLDLEADKAALGCAQESSCLAEIAEALSVEVLVTGTLARVGDDHVFGLKALDQREAKVRAGFNKVFPADDGTGFLAEIGSAVETLFPDVPLRIGQVRGVDEEAVRRLAPPPLPAWMFWAGVGTSAGLMAGALAAGTTQLIFYGEYQALAAQSARESVSGARLVEAGALAQRSEIVAWSLFGAGLVVGVLTGATFPLIDLDGYGAE